MKKIYIMLFLGALTSTQVAHAAQPIVMCPYQRPGMTLEQTCDFMCEPEGVTWGGVGACSTNKVPVPEVLKYCPHSTFDGKVADGACYCICP